MSYGEVTFNRRAVKPLECMRGGWQLVRNDFWLFLGITFVGNLIAGLGPFGILLGPMMCGIYICLFRQESGRRVTFEKLFDGFHFFGQSIVPSLIMFGVIMLFFIPVYIVFFIGMLASVAATAPAPGQTSSAPPDPTPLFAFLGLYMLLIAALVVFATLVQMFFLFAYPLIVDRGLSGWEATKLSFRSVMGNFGGVLGVVLLHLLMTFVGVMACYVGAIFVMPAYYGMVAVAYRQVFPAEGSVLFPPRPDYWPEEEERAAPPGETGILGSRESPITADPPADPGVPQPGEAPSEPRP
jgi:hypothetical protein